MITAQEAWKMVYRDWRKTHRYSIHALQKRRDSMASKAYTAALERKLAAAQRTIDAQAQALKKIEDQASRAALVQDRSVGIIKQTCKIIADEAKEAQPSR